MNLYAILTMATTLAAIVGVSEVVTLAGQVQAAEGNRTDLLAPLYGYVLLFLLLFLSDGMADVAAGAPLRGARLSGEGDARTLRSAPGWTPDQPLVVIDDVHKSFGTVEVLKCQPFGA
jgi:hypothetical protein